MCRLSRVLILIVAGVLCLGIYQKWFRFSSETTDGKTHITFTADTDKFHEDEKNTLEKAKELGHQAKEKVSEPAEKDKE